MMEILKKENLLIAVAVVCLAIYAYRKTISQSQQAQEVVKFLPIIGGLAFGFNTLITLTK